MGGGAWPFLVGITICLVNSINERDLNLLTSYAEVCDALRCSGPHARYTDVFNESIAWADRVGSLSKPRSTVRTRGRVNETPRGRGCPPRPEPPPAQGGRDGRFVPPTGGRNDRRRPALREQRTPGANRAKEPKRKRSARAVAIPSAVRARRRRDSFCREKTKRLSATDISALASMKNVAKCDTWCELQNPVNHRVFERKLRPKPLGRGHACLGVMHRRPPSDPPPSGGRGRAEDGLPRSRGSRLAQKRVPGNDSAVTVGGGAPGVPRPR
ncbi:uncharacterized protein LOC111278348 [Durio zibethinus]|uniref:Uncharacterized protein LOC111278348 n=1 Tax=Durio zibethinus TaxID=66656 RepID=A0A6P5WYZ9_DURZI|nr:uncharacterized protein LOC111278348 [Durio zibethinus]